MCKQEQKVSHNIRTTLRRLTPILKWDTDRFNIPGGGADVFVGIPGDITK